MLEDDLQPAGVLYEFGGLAMGARVHRRDGRTRRGSLFRDKVQAVAVARDTDGSDQGRVDG